MRLLCRLIAVLAVCFTAGCAMYRPAVAPVPLLDGYNHTTTTAELREMVKQANAGNIPLEASDMVEFTLPEQGAICRTARYKNDLAWACRYTATLSRKRACYLAKGLPEEAGGITAHLCFNTASRAAAHIARYTSLSAAGKTIQVNTIYDGTLQQGLLYHQP